VVHRREHFRTKYWLVFNFEKALGQEQGFLKVFYFKPNPQRHVMLPSRTGVPPVFAARTVSGAILAPALRSVHTCPPEGHRDGVAGGARECR